MLEKSNRLSINTMEAALAEMPEADFSVVNRFTPGMYIREVTIPAGVMFTSMKHKTTHPFVMNKGKIKVISENEGEVSYEAPLTGITQAGTHRVVHVEEEVVWTTFHVTEETDIDLIAQQILEPHENDLIEDKKRLNKWSDPTSQKTLCHS